MARKDLIVQIGQFMQEIVKEENINLIKLSESFTKGIYVNNKYGKVKTVMNFQISDDEFVFTVNINKDENGNIIMFNIKKDDI